MIIMVHYLISRFSVDVELNVKDLRLYASRIKHLQMKVCAISDISKTSIVAYGFVLFLLYFVTYVLFHLFQVQRR